MRNTHQWLLCAPLLLRGFEIHSAAAKPLRFRWVLRQAILPLWGFAKRWWAALVLSCLCTCISIPALAATNAYSLAFAPGPPDNPLKGFMPFSGVYNTFPYSMEWGYLPLRSLMTGPTNFQWTSLDNLLQTVAARGRQTVFRVYLDYPTRSTGIPQYLLDAGLKTYSYNDYGNNGVSLCPDYQNELLAQALTNFIAALGDRYDGDPRIGFVQLGLLGYWGEWHTYPENFWFASVTLQNQVLKAYTNAFHKTRLLVRWPAGNLPAGPLPLGYHDDSFAYSTIDPPDWMFMGLLKAAGETGKWRTQPIGGEVRPEVQPCLWDTNQPNCVPAGQGFSNCVAVTHASWMLNHKVFNPGFTGSQLARALDGARQLGYEFYVSNSVVVDPRVSGVLQLKLDVLNTGVAPFYYDWPVQIGVLDSTGHLVQSWSTPWKISTLMPASNTTWNLSLTNHGLAPGKFKALLRVVNPLTNGVPLRFANQAQDLDLPGWLTLGQFSVLADLSAPTLRATTTSQPPGVSLQVESASPGTWTIEGTSNLLSWDPLFTTNTSTSRWSFEDNVSAATRFYRVVGSP